MTPPELLKKIIDVMGINVSKILGKGEKPNDIFQMQVLQSLWKF